jgi:fatty-acyl-CoA synthase
MASEAEPILEALAREHCSRVIARPELIERLLGSPRIAQLDLSGLRGGFVAGGRCPPEILRAAAVRLHMPEALTSYGMTESNHIGLQPSLTDAIERRADSAGAVQPHIETKLVDAEGRIVPVGEAGELCLRGYPVLSGYWDTSARLCPGTDAAGWLHTGDRAVMDSEGICRIAGGP